jgi:hypothetical protein
MPFTAKESAASRSAAHPSTKRRSMKFSVEQRHEMIAEAAYYLAEKRGFQGGCPMQDWLDAEAHIDRQYFRISPALRNSLVFL